MIEFINSIQPWFVLLVFVIAATLIAFKAMSNKDPENHRHQEKMADTQRMRDEALAKWEYERTKTIDGKAIEHKPTQQVYMETEKLK